MTRPVRRLGRLPAGPLLAAIERHPAIRKPQRGAEAYRQAARDGLVSLTALERLCDAFGWHPRELYGDAYDQAAFAGRSARFDPWKGIA